MEDIITVSEAARRLNRPKNHKLLRAIIEREGIPIRRVGKADVMTGSGFRRLEKAVSAWDARLRPRGRRAEVAAPA